MHNVTYRFFEIRIFVKVMVSLTPTFTDFLQLRFVFCVNSKCIREIIKKAMLPLIHLNNRKHTSFPQSFRVSKI